MHHYLYHFFVANSAYSLYQYLLLFPESLDKTLFIVGPALEKANLPNKVTFQCAADKSQEKICEHAFLSKVEAALDGRRISGYVNMSTPFCEKLPDRYTVIPLSDGLSDLTLFPKYLKDPRFPRCYTTQLDNALDKENPKLKVVDLARLWREKTEYQQALISDVFGVKADELAILRKKKVILVTQPLSEDGIVSEADKQKLYKSIVSQYDPNDVVIKPHPRELTPWGEVFPGMPVISRQVPAELLSAMLDLRKVCTFFSTAAFSMTTPENVDIYSKDFSRLVFSHPGGKMGRMPYVDIEKAYGHLPFNWKRLPENSFYRSDKDKFISRMETFSKGR